MSKKNKKQVELNEELEMEEDEMVEEASKESEPTTEEKGKKKYLTKENLIKTGKYLLVGTLSGLAGFGLSKLCNGKDKSYDEDESSYDNSNTEYCDEVVEDTEE